MILTGTIHDSVTGQPVKGTVQLFYNPTGQLLPGSVSLNPGDVYTIDLKDDPASSYTLVVTAYGYKDYRIPVTDLNGTNDILLLEKRPLNTEIAVLFVGAGALALTASGKRKVSGTDSGTANTVIMVTGLAVGYVAIHYLLKKLGLLPDPTKPEQQDPNSAFNPGYWQQFDSYTYAITEDQARQMGDIIHNAFTLAQDDYNAVFSVFSSLKTKANVSFLAWEFSKEYDENLLAFLTDGGGILPWDGLSQDHLQTIINYVHNLPSH